MAFIPYSCQQIDDTDLAAVEQVLRSDFLTQGPAVEEFEQAFAARHNVAHAIAVCNATAALHMACLALGMGPGKRVWTSPNSFVASANCAVYCGASINFVDIDPVTRNISLAALTERLEAADLVGMLPDLVIPVDFSGLPCDYREIRALADRFNFHILQDASHAAGASYRGEPVGSCFADISVFSFHAVKVVTTGEGGMATTQDARLAHRLEMLRSHGITRDIATLEHSSEGGWYYEQQLLGFNYRITDMQAALGSSQLRRMDAMQVDRERHAARYDALLAGLPLKLPARLGDRRSAWHLYAVEIGKDAANDRTAVFAGMRTAEIGVNVHYIPIHTQPYYRRLGFDRGDFPNAEAYYAQAISLPLFPRMTYAQQDRVVETLAGLVSA